MQNKWENNSEQNALIWKVSHPNTTKVSYLFGTNHKLDVKKTNPIIKNIVDSNILNSVDLILTEVGDVDNDSDKIFEGSSLLPMKDKVIKKYKKTMDYNLTSLGTELGIPVLPLEKIDQGVNALAEAQASRLFKPKNIAKGLAITLTFPIGIPIYVIQRVIKNKAMLHRSEKHYLHQDITYDYFNHKEVDRKLIINNRNQFWFNNGVNNFNSSNKKLCELFNQEDLNENCFAIKNLLDKYNLFIAVGAGHLISNGFGLIEILKENGYSVTPVNIIEQPEHHQSCQVI
ncbi:hypothetical protein ACNVED_04130 [Legionella sp. D16C41]|uniref:hypothetical protein n=1 Tax=Legionella sp. D16C41 TaxID=3402688 RepID=UPI003AF43DD0